MFATRSRFLVLAAWALLAPAVRAAEPASPAVEEEVDLDALDAQEAPAARRAPIATRVPEHEYDLRLLALPALLVSLLAWHVRWRPTSRVRS